MKIITWNCNMAFRKKAQFILEYKPDILIVPECECPDKLIFMGNIPPPTQILWYGTNNSKGIGIFSFSDFRFREIGRYNKDLKMIIPLEVNNGLIQFNLFAIWANNSADKANQYVGQIWKALSHYKEFLSHNHSILIGDFNSNAIWDKPRRLGNHSHVVEELKERNIYSCYHNYFKVQQGKEGHPTLYMYRHSDKGYHIDYCFASQFFINKLSLVEVGEHAFWKSYSDHVPLIVNFDFD